MLKGFFSAELCSIFAEQSADTGQNSVGSVGRVGKALS